MKRAVFTKLSTLRPIFHLVSKGNMRNMTQNACLFNEHNPAAQGKIATAPTPSFIVRFIPFY